MTHFKRGTLVLHRPIPNVDEWDFCHLALDDHGTMLLMLRVESLVVHWGTDSCQIVRADEDRTWVVLGP